MVIAFAASPVLGQEALSDEREPFSISGRVTEAVSGSDIIVAGKSVHLEGTRAPKRGRICLRNGDSVDIGTEAAEGFARKVVGSEATLSVHTDENGRLVGRGTIGGQDIGEIAILGGFAVTKIGDYSYTAQEREARNNRPGLWSCSSFPKTESAPETTAIAPAPRALPPPIEVKPLPSPKSRNTVEYLPPDAQLPPQPSEQEEDFDLVLDDVGGFLEGIFTGIDRGIRELFGAPPPAPPTEPR
jgi:endonuclease YncB( thermonuclease family)